MTGSQSLTNIIWSAKLALNNTNQHQFHVSGVNYYCQWDKDCKNTKKQSKYKLNPGLIIRDKLKVSILLFTTTSPTLLLFLTFYTFDHSTYWFSMLVNRRNRKHRSSVQFRKLLLYRGNEEWWYSAFPNIPLPSWLFLILWIISECRTSVLHVDAHLW